MILHRCFAYNSRARLTEPDGALWFPREYQGEGRHDNPDVYGCLYLTDREPSAVVEQLARFRGQRLVPEMLMRRMLPLAVAAIELPDEEALVDLDDPGVLTREALRPSRVATRERRVTQPQALALYHTHPTSAGLTWWSVYESLWTNATLFDRVAPRLRLVDIRVLAVDDAAVTEAAEALGIAP